MDTKQLRQKILDLAIHGKLVSQNPADEPAAALLKRINPKAEIMQEDVPFELPEGWCWCKLGDITHIWSARRVHEKDWRTTGIPFYRAREIGKIADNGYVNNDLFIEKSLYDEFSRSGVPNVGDLMMTAVGTLGKTYVVETEEPFYFKDGSVLCIGNPYSFDPYYLKYYFDSWFFCSQYMPESGGTTVATLTMVRLNRYLIPLPPLPEQHRIASKIEELFAALDQIERNKTALQTAIKQTKSKILDLAIHGKLVPQSPADEPAAGLLKRIKAEKERLVKEGKLKRSKKEESVLNPECFDEDIPENWCWVRLGDIFQHNNGKQKSASNQKGLLRKYITTSNVYWNEFDLSDVKEMSFMDSELEKCTAKKGDLLVCEGGDIGRAAIWDYDYPICIQNHLHRLRAYVPVCTKYFLYCLMDRKAKGYIKGKGIGLMGLSSNELHNILIPLPPLPEQRRIVAKIEELFAALDRIGNSLG